MHIGSEMLSLLCRSFFTYCVMHPKLIGLCWDAMSIVFKLGSRFLIYKILVCCVIIKTFVHSYSRMIIRSCPLKTLGCNLRSVPPERRCGAAARAGGGGGITWRGGLVVVDTSL